MKLNWGWSITFVYVIFMAGILTLVYLSTSYQPELIREDYYEAAQTHQDHIDATNRSKKLSTQPTLIIQNKKLNFTFPYNTTADIQFYNPSNKSADQNHTIDVENYSWNLDNFKSGQYIAKCYWKLNKMNYYWEQEFTVP